MGSTSEAKDSSSSSREEPAQLVHQEINIGEETIHAKRIPGKWRNLKWISNTIWLIFFFGPYLRWDDRQAVLWDIPNRQFHLFAITILPQDFWLLSLVLLFFAMLLAVATAIAGRVWCGFFCFQTVWTDVFTWIEDKLEGSPQKRRKLEKAPSDANKIRIKAIKHLLWLLISVFTGISFVAWFTDAYRLWVNLVTFEASSTAYITILIFTVGTYLLAGFMREQTCLWLCPYARIQSAMVDKHTLIPTYDASRGEPRGHVRKKIESMKKSRIGDCIDCRLCVGVCPTGVDIRAGLQEGCLMCALCIDACDAVMSKLGRARGLIRYASFDEMESGVVLPLSGRTRIWVYGFISLIAAGGIVYGLSSLDSIELKVLHARQPMYVMQSDGSIQNQYTLKVLNKMTRGIDVRVSAAGPAGLVLTDMEKPITAHGSTVTSTTVFARVPRKNLNGESNPIIFRIDGALDSNAFSSERESIFVGPKKPALP
uniref:Cytochrome c oxidase accessory protein FixG n=1 Tax=Candidatus Kentrum sp. SD TaxID=2126332 RepID=A0A451BLD5_9GAMM|nr:MAG: cytochrome c oxidase accessory protein FixG [Candidatus Kentron sp. SD]VFK40184.1 MAG: cytochrome c oxidase accessory protein FixG [Candidatus Kentron sp. SD]VFK79081.1 MAG: cytochrome c oxidase accessory protein FixG [Candidatus Kentron sp. SD]